MPRGRRKAPTGPPVAPWEPSKLSPEQPLEARRAAVLELAKKLSHHAGSATARVIPLPEQSLAVRMLAELADDADAAHDWTSVCSVLSCVANLRLVGLPSADIGRASSLVVRHAASAKPEVRSFACAAAFNLSQEPWVLDTLASVHAAAGNQPLRVRPSDPPEVAQQARAALERIRGPRCGGPRVWRCARWLVGLMLLGLMLFASPLGRRWSREGAAATATAAAARATAPPPQPRPRVFTKHHLRPPTAPAPLAARLSPHHISSSNSNHSRARRPAHPPPLNARQPAATVAASPPPPAASAARPAGRAGVGYGGGKL